MVVDNIDRPELSPILRSAERRDMQRVDFLGPVLGSGRLGMTSLFGFDLGPLLRRHPALAHRGYWAASDQRDRVASAP